MQTNANYPGNRLRQWRVDAGLSQDDVADLTGLSKSMVSLVERGMRELAPMTKVRVARGLGVRISELFGAEEVSA